MSQPGPDEAKWYVCLPGGSPEGPLSIDQVLEGVERGAFPAGSMACRAGESRWKPVEAVQRFGDATELIDDSTTVNDDMVETMRRPDETPTPPDEGPTLRRGGPTGTQAMPVMEAPVPPPPPWQASPSEGPVAAPSAPPAPAPAPAPYPSNTPPPHASNAPPQTGQRKSIIAVMVGGAVLGLAALGAGALWLQQRAAVPGEPSASSNAEPARDPAAPSGDPSAAAPPPSSSVTSEPAGEKPAASGGDAEARCKDVIGLPEVVCTWVVATSEGREAERPSYEMLQTFFLSQNIMRAKGRIKSDPLGEGLVKVTLDGVFGYCLRPAEPVENGALYQKWIRKHEGTREIQSADGKTETCVLLEEVPVVGPIDALMSADSPAEREKRARLAVEAIVAYEPLARADEP